MKWSKSRIIKIVKRWSCKLQTSTDSLIKVIKFDLEVNILYLRYTLVIHHPKLFPHFLYTFKNKQKTPLSLAVVHIYHSIFGPHLRRITKAVCALSHSCVDILFWPYMGTGYGSMFASCLTSAVRRRRRTLQTLSAHMFTGTERWPPAYLSSLRSLCQHPFRHLHFLFLIFVNALRARADFIFRTHSVTK